MQNFLRENNVNQMQWDQGYIDKNKGNKYAMTNYIWLSSVFFYLLVKQILPTWRERKDQPQSRSRYFPTTAYHFSIHKILCGIFFLLDGKILCVVSSC